MECAYKANSKWAGISWPVRGRKRLGRSELTEFDVKADPFKGRNPWLSFYLRILSSGDVSVRPFISVFVGPVLSAVAGAFGGAIERNVSTKQIPFGQVLQSLSVTTGAFGGVSARSLL